MTDTVSVTITGSTGETTTIDDWTSFTFDSDFFLPCDAFSLYLESSNVQQLTTGFQYGDTIQIKINDKIQCTGYIEHVHRRYGRPGNAVTINGRNKLGLLSDHGINPFIQADINSNSTYGDIFNSVFKPFGFEIVETDDGTDVLAKTGGKSGLSVKTGKKGAAKSLSNQQGRQLKPNKGEGYLGYIIRLCSHNGWYLRLSGDGKTVMIFPPSYADPQYQVTHLGVQDGETFALDNNILSCSLDINAARQPSVIMAECNSLGGGGQFRISNHKVIKVNDILGYDSSGDYISASTSKQDQKTNANTNLSDLISFANNSGSRLLSRNTDLVDAVGNGNLIPYGGNLSNMPMRAEYFYDERAGSPDELAFRVQQKMWQYQNDFFTLNYEVDGFTNNGLVWGNNTMVKVTDEALGVSGVYWISKVTFSKSRGSGSRTMLQLKLPYIYQ